MVELLGAVGIFTISFIGGYLAGKRWGFKGLVFTPPPFGIAFIALLAIASQGGTSDSLAGLVFVAILVLIFGAATISSTGILLGVIVGTLRRKSKRS